MPNTVLHMLAISHTATLFQFNSHLTMSGTVTWAFIAARLQLHKHWQISATSHRTLAVTPGATSTTGILEAGTSWYAGGFILCFAGKFTHIC